MLEDSKPIVAVSDLAPIATILALEGALIPELEDLVGNLLHVRELELVAHFIHQEQSLLEDDESVEGTSEEPESVVLRCEVKVALVLRWHFYFFDHFTAKESLPPVERILHPFIDVFPSSEPGRARLSAFLESLPQFSKPLLEHLLQRSMSSPVREYSFSRFSSSLP